MRLSNVLPHSSAQFDITRHLTRGDVLFGQQICTVLIKWSKAMQGHRETTTINIPALGSSSLCPITALQNMYTSIVQARGFGPACRFSSQKALEICVFFVKYLPAFDFS